MNKKMNRETLDLILHALIKTGSDIVIVTDSHNKVIVFNTEAEKYFSCHKQDALNKDYTLLCTLHPIQTCDNTQEIEWSSLQIDAPDDTRFTLITGKRTPQRLIIENDIKDQLRRLTLEKIQAEADNKTISQYLQDIISVVPGSIYWKNKEGIYLGCNDFMVHTAGLRSKADIIGKSDFQLWPNQAAQLRETDQNVMNMGQSIRLEEEVLLPNGKKLFFIVGKMPLRDLDGNINGIIGNSLDITELKETQIALESANRAKTEFIANMGHDIRTPLTGVIGLSEALESELENPKQKQFANIIRESGNQLLSLINGILDVISTDNINEQDILYETFDLQECIQGIAELVCSSILNKGLTFSVNIDSAIPTYIVSDRTKLHRVLLNLLGNAIKFTNTGGIEIQVSLVTPKKESVIVSENGGENKHVTLHFVVKDTGIGIPVEQQSHVFDRFFRINPSYQGGYKGNGIGLHIAQSYVTLLGGKIQLKSQENVGTTFCFDLSFKTGDQQDIICKPSHFANLSNKKNTTVPCISNRATPLVLLVEDNPTALIVIENLVNRVGLQYLCAVDGESALILTKTHDFALIITDLGLPGISGIELTKQIREWEMTRHKKPIPIIGLSAHAREEALVNCLPNGMTDVFSKPITIDMLKALKNNYILGNYQPEAQLPPLFFIPKSTEPLGWDLPETREQLFNLDQFPVFDAKLALFEMNSNAVLLPVILKDFLEKDLPNTLSGLKRAYHENNWDKIEKRVHYMKSTLNFTGTPRLKHACQYLERYRKAGHYILLDKLYHQLIDIGQATEHAIRQWLQQTH